ncbi:MAG TPA: AsmA family protein [Candidatus Angelobacter sp.]
MRKLGIAVLIIVVVLVAAALIVPHLVDINKYHNRVQAELEKKLGRQVSLGEMRLSLFPPSFQVADPVIAEDKSFDTGRPFATAQKLAVSIKLLPLLHKELDVRSLELERPHIELVRNAQGEWNFATLGNAKPAPAETETTPAQQPSNKTGKQHAPATQTQQPAPQQPQQTAQQNPQPDESAKKPAGELTLANLEITDGQVAITDLQKHESRAVYDHIDLSLSNFSPDSEFNVKVTAHLPGQGKQTVALEGKGGPIKQADMLNTNFDGTLNLNQVSIAGVEKFLNSQALSGIEAQISGNAKVKNGDGKMASSGSIKLENPRIRNVDVGYPITLDYDVADDLKTDVIQIHRGNIKLGSTPITIAGTLNTRPTPSQIDMKLTASNASIAEAARLASAFGVAFGQGMDVKGNVNADIQAKGAMDKPSMNGQLSARNLEISGKELAQPVKVDAIELALTPDTIKSNDFTATTGSTSVSVNFALSQYTAPNSVVNASLRAANAKVGELLNMAKAYGVSAVDGMSGDGLLSLDVHAQGPTKNPDAMIFNGSGKIQNASLKMPSLTKPVEIKNSDLAFSQNGATLQNVALSLGQTNANGNVTVKNFAAPQVQFTLKADKVNVAELQQITGATSATPNRAATDQSFWRLVPTANAQAKRPEQPAPKPASAQPGMIEKMTGGGTIDIGAVQYDDLLLNNVHTNVTLDHGLIQMNPLTSQLYGGQQTGSVSIDMRPAQPIYTVNLKTDKVDANKLISSVSSVKQVLYGLLNSNVNATFSSTSAEAIARGLNGKLGINLTNGKLANLDLLHELAAVGKFVGGLPNAPAGFTNLVQLSGDFDVKNGVAQTNNLKAEIEGGTLAAAGLVNLVDNSLNLHVTAVLNNALSKQVGGTGIGGFMNTALANNDGELVMPVIVTGTLQHPQVAPDVQQLAQMKLHNLLPTSKNPGALTSGILGAITGNNQGKGGIGGILGTLSGQQQQQQQNQQQNNGAVGNNAGQQQTPQNQSQPPPNQNQNPVGDALNQLFGKKKQPNQKQQPNPPK